MLCQPALLQANVENRLGFMKQMLLTWIHKPTNVRPLYRLLPNARPILKQLVRSGYVFSFMLPYPLPTFLGRIGDYWMFRLLNAFSDDSNERPTEPVPGTPGWNQLASSLGPGFEELKTELEHSAKSVDPLQPDDDIKYPESVRSRVSTGGWYDKIRYYRDDLIFAPWNKSLQLVWELNQIQTQHESFTSTSSTSSAAHQRRRSSAAFKTVGVFDMGPKGTLGAATTILWGAKDVAVSSTLAMEGISDYFGVRESHYIVLPRVGHWTPLSGPAFGTWRAIVSWAAQGEDTPLKDRLQDFPAAKIKLVS
jgi:hypothetical protein